MGELKKSTGIMPTVRKRVLERDNRQCVICGQPYCLELAHYISRAQLGLGIPKNLVCLCKKCHMAYDGTKRAEYGEILRDYLKGWYPDWDEKELVYDKWKWTKEYVQSEDKTGSGSEI